MKKFLVAGIAAAAFYGAPVFAADMPSRAPVYKAAPAPMYNWSGFYVGIAGGWVSGSNDVDLLPPSAGSFSSRLRGGLVGGEYGYNWQFNNWLFGTESDLSWSNAKSTIAVCGAGFSCEDKVRWLSTSRVRVGVTAGPTGNWLFYGTGGLADGSVRRSDTSAAGASLNQNKMNWGWTIGGGVEVGFAPNWSFKIEALYVDLDGSKTYPAVGLFANEHINEKFGVYRVGLNYRFGDLFGKTPVTAKY